MGCNNVLVCKCVKCSPFGFLVRILKFLNISLVQDNKNIIFNVLSVAKGKGYEPCHLVNDLTGF